MKPKIYEPVTEFERQTSYSPLYLAWRIVDEARDYFRTDIPEAFADKLARRAEAVFARHPFWQRRFKSASGRHAILTAMRHWLAGVLARENPVLFRQLPEDFKIGHPLPIQPHPMAAVSDAQKSPGNSRPRRARSDESRPRLVHGCELLPV
jgi:hypothetical protein